MSAKMQPKSIKRIIALALLVGALGTVFLIAHRPQLLAFAGASQTESGGRKVLYWYDSMNPAHHYDKPGKAPDGMDLVPAYD